MNKKSKATITYYTASTEDGKITALCREISKSGKIYTYYDVKVGNIIIRDCKLVDGKNGEFIGSPSKTDKDGNYHPLVYLNEPLHRAIVNLINDAEWEETEDTMLTFEDTMLTFEDAKKRKPGKGKSKSKSKSKPDEDDDEDDDEDEDNDYPF